MALAALASILALLAADPAQTGAAAPDTPQATQPSAPAAAPETLPAGAPEDDYGFMGWCYGALAAHLDLYQSVLPQVQRIETAFPAPHEKIDQVMADYADQNTRGRKILTRYSRAMDVEEAKGATGGVSREDAIAKGREIWSGSDQADPRQVAQLWMSWALPGRCSAVARRLTGRR